MVVRYGAGGRQDDLVPEVLEKLAGVLAREEAASELGPPQSGSHLDTKPHRLVSRVPREMWAARRGHDSGPDAGLHQDPIDLEGGPSFQDLPAFLHAGMGVTGRSMTGASPPDLHLEQFCRLDEELDLLPRALVLDHTGSFVYRHGTNSQPVELSAPTLSPLRPGSA
jgi:hypothetical protein